MAQSFSIDDLAKLLQQTNTKKPRKKIERTAEQEKAMKERLATMREKSLQARQAKAAANPTIVNHNIPIQTPSLEIKKLNEKDTDELFEKKYNSRFEKLDETVGHIKSSIEEMKEAKKQKALEKQKAKEEKIQEQSQKVEASLKVQEFAREQVQQVQQIQQVKQVQQVQQNKNPLAIPKVPDYKNMFKKYPY